jgi:hypothetical protein
MLAQAHGYPGHSPAGRSPVVLHPNASHGLPSPYDAAAPRRHRLAAPPDVIVGHLRRYSLRLTLAGRVVRTRRAGQAG